MSTVTRTRIAAAVVAGIGLLAANQAARATDIACDFTSENPGVVTVAAGCTVNSAIFNVPDANGTVGTGTINAFLTTQTEGNQNNYPTESGFNSDSSPPGNAPLDTKRYGGTGRDGFTNSLLLSEIPTITIGPNSYYEFLLDINQFNSEPHLSLDVLRLFVAPGDGTYNSSNATAPYNYDIYDKDPSTTNAVDNPTAFDQTGAPGYDPVGSSKFATSAVNVWSLDSGGVDRSILLDYNLCGAGVLPFQCAKGSGNDFDLRWLVPVTAFNGWTSNSWVILYTSYGWLGSNYCRTYNGQQVCDDFRRNDGFEEWSVRTNAVCAPTDPTCLPTDVPEPGSLALLGLGLMGIALSRRRRLA